jgi:importin subunit beta-1
MCEMGRARKRTLGAQTIRLRLASPASHRTAPHRTAPPVAMDASGLLSSTLSPVTAERENATAQLVHLLQTNPDHYLISLSNALANPASPSHIRNAAGLAIKNTLSAREAARQEEYASRWKSLDGQTRDKLKADALATLAAADKQARNVAGQVVAAIAALELPVGLWAGLISQLLELSGPSDNAGLRQATLQAIGYICESIVSRRARGDGAWR